MALKSKPLHGNHRSHRRTWGHNAEIGLERKLASYCGEDEKVAALDKLIKEAPATDKAPEEPCVGMIVIFLITLALAVIFVFLNIYIG